MLLLSAATHWHRRGPPPAAAGGAAAGGAAAGVAAAGGAPAGAAGGLAGRCGAASAASAAAAASLAAAAAGRGARRAPGRQPPPRAAAVARRAAAAGVAVADDVGAQRLSPEATLQADAPVVGHYEVVRPREALDRRFVRVASLGAEGGPALGARVWVRARVATVRVKGKSSFVVLREHSLHSVQAVKFKSKEDGGESAAAVAKFFKGLPLESVVDLCGVAVEAQVNSCTQKNVELQIERVYCVSQAAAALPFLMADASRTDADIEASLKTDRPFVRVLQDLRLDHRWLDLRVPAHNATLRIKAAVSRLYREALDGRGFVEIHSPKLIAGESEGGAEVFRTDYFGRRATLAQSPQIYKQMALSADLPGVYEVGPVFRAENSNTNRHLCEFTGLDLEMPIDWHYSEVIHLVHATLEHVFRRLEEDSAAELAVVREMYPSSPPAISSGGPCILHWPEAMQLLADSGVARDPMEDLSTEEERSLGAIVLEKYGTDLFFLDRYPSSVRPWYTMPDADEPQYSNSYDCIFRGQEIGSGAQRCHDPAVLERRLADLGVPAGPLQPYIEAFRHGVPPHGGVGLGLERIVQLYLGLDNIRKATLFARDPARLSP